MQHEVHQAETQNLKNQLSDGADESEHQAEIQHLKNQLMERSRDLERRAYTLQFRTLKPYTSPDIGRVYDI